MTEKLVLDTRYVVGVESVADLTFLRFSMLQ